MNYKDHYKPEKLNECSPLLVEALLSKYENDFGVLEVVRFGVAMRYGINDKTVLEKSLAYYNKQSDTRAYWYYISDVEKLVNHNKVEA
jgi:hypothetical protein